jgi:flagellar basal-body rod protein FlgB
MIGYFDKLRVNDLNYALNTLSEKTNQISRNIANADTPKYRAKKLEFDTVMQEYFSNSNPVKLYTTDELHMQPFSTPLEPINFLKLQNNPSTRTDGNDVNIEYETSELAASSIMYDMLTTITGNKFAALKEIIQR